MTTAFYAEPSYMYGGGAYTVYTGQRRQYGGSLLGSIKRHFAPIQAVKRIGVPASRAVARGVRGAASVARRGLRTAANVAGRGIRTASRAAVKGVKTASRNELLRSAAQKALEQGVMIGTNVAVDALQGRNVGESIKQRSAERALNVLTGADDEPPPRGNPPSVLRGRKRLRSYNLKQTPSNGATYTTSDVPAAKRRRRIRAYSRARRNRLQLF